MHGGVLVRAPVTATYYIYLRRKNELGPKKVKRRHQWVAHSLQVLTITISYALVIGF